MKKYTSIIITSFVLIFFLTTNAIFAQEFSPIGKLAQEYIQRINQELQKTNNSVPGPKQEAVVVNPEAIILDAVTDSIDTISKTVEEVKKEKVKVIENIKTSVKEDIDSSIIQIRKNIEKPAYELQKAVDTERTQLFEDVSKTIDEIKPTEVKQETQKIAELKDKIDTSINTIQKKLEDESGLPVNFEKSKRDVKDTLLKFEQVLQEKKDIIESRQGEYVFKDTDSDGISDYDEIYIYKTDPNNSKTKGEGKTDGEKIIEGINPLSENEEKINFQDPREDKESFVTSSYKVDKVELVKEEKKLVFGGTALPNTYITLYIFSTPIIVTVKTDANGQWSYALEKELENGEHQMYVATTDTSGKIVARSNPILFTKSAEAATIGIAGSIDSSVNQQNFLKDNFILISLAIFIAVVILGMMFVGNHKTVKSAVMELKNQVNTK